MAIIAKVPRRRFGRTNIDLPVFSCGGMRYQHSWDDVDPAEIPDLNQKNVEKVIERALSHGINHIETARGYGTSEIQLGRILPQVPREELIVQTKVGPKEDPAEFVKVFNTSMDNLQLDYVDLFSIHGINNRELLDQSLNGCIQEAIKLKEAGRVRHIGFSTHASTNVIIDAINSGAFDYINLHWYFVNDFNWPAIQMARQQDMGVFIISPNDKGGKLYAPPQKLVDLCHPYHPMQFNDLYCLCRDEVHTLSLGASKPSDFDEHIDAMRMYHHRDKTADPIAKRLNRELKQGLGADWFDNWYVGLPECDLMPNHVNVREILRLYNFAKGLDMVEFAKMRYNLLGNADHWFPGNTAAELDVPALEKALQHSPFTSKVIDTLAEAHEAMVEAPVKRASEGG